MKNTFLKIICTCLALCSVLTLCSCNGGNGSQTEATEATAAPPSTAEPTTVSAEQQKTTDLSTLHSFAAQGDQFTGNWKISEGTGSQLKNFIFRFDGNGKAYLIIGNMGFVGSYAVKSENNQDLFITQLLYGLDGKYTYRFSKDKTSVVLTNIKDKTTSTLVKQENVTEIPAAEDSPSIDNALLGAWSDGNGSYLYFDKNGIMYETQKGIGYTFYLYSAADGVVTATYKMKETTTETADYSLKDNVLTYDNCEYNPVSADELP